MICCAGCFTRSYVVSFVSQSDRCSIADFLQELPVLVKEAMPTLSKMFGEDIESKLGVRELQTAFVHSLVLGKKARVSAFSQHRKLIE